MKSYIVLGLLMIFASQTYAQDFAEGKPWVPYEYEVLAPFENQGLPSESTLSFDNQKELRAPVLPGDPGGEFETPVVDSLAYLSALAFLYQMVKHLFRKKQKSRN